MVGWRFLVLVLAVHVACAVNKPYGIGQSGGGGGLGKRIAGVAWGWPSARALICLEVCHGSTVLVPFEGMERWVRPPEMSHPYDVRLSWFGPGGRRVFEINCRQELPVSDGMSDDQVREVLRRELVDGEDGVSGVRPIALDSHRGVEVETRWEGMSVMRRAFVTGNGGVVLYAASAEGDPFPEAALFFESLSVGGGGVSSTSGRKACVSPLE